MGTVSFHNGLFVNGARGSKMVAQTLSMGKKPDANHITSITDADTAHIVENLKKLNFEVLEHPLYSLDLKLSDSSVWST
jgi:ABC-type cobalamin/Fe3+-siderophores transport system ATPase subunit